MSDEERITALEGVFAENAERLQRLAHELDGLNATLDRVEQTHAEIDAGLDRIQALIDE